LGTTSTAGSACSPCAAGTYGTTTGSASICTLCPQNTYSDVVGATSSGVCNNCASGSTAAPGSTSPSACVVCPKDSIINAAGVCVTCSSLFGGNTQYRTPGPGYIGSQNCTLSLV
jgi:hypothetical protein